MTNIKRRKKATDKGTTAKRAAHRKHRRIDKKDRKDKRVRARRDKKLKTRTPHIIKERIRIKGERAHRHEKEYHVKGHFMHARNGKRVWIKPHTAHIHEDTYPVKAHTEKRTELRYGGHFNEVAKKIAREYMKKGIPKKEAEEIGRATAADVYRHKLAKSYSK